MELFDKKFGFVSPDTSSIVGRYGIDENYISIIYRDSKIAKTNPSYSICFGSWGNFNKYKFFTIAIGGNQIYFGFHNDPNMKKEATVSLSKGGKNQTATIYSKTCLEFLMDFIGVEKEGTFKANRRIEKYIEDNNCLIYTMDKDESIDLFKLKGIK